MSKRVLALSLVVMIVMAAMPIFAVAAEKYTTEENTADGFIVVKNPNGKPQLSYSPDSGVELLEATEGAYTYAFKDLNGNGKLDKYEDWRLSSAERAEDLIAQMTIEQIAPLMMASWHFSSVSGDLETSSSMMGSNTKTVVEKGMRFVLNASASTPPAGQAQWNNSMQALAEASELGIPVQVFSDPRSNAGAADGAYSATTSTVSKWPGSLGFAATFDPNAVLEFGKITSQEYRALGIHTGLSPQIDVGTEPRWNRIGGTYGESSTLSADMAKAYTKGFQTTYVDGKDAGWGDDSVAVMLKHWPGDAPGESGRESHSPVGKYAVYPGNNLSYHVAPFEAAIKDVTGTELAAAIMPAYSIGLKADGSPLGTDTKQAAAGYSPYKMGMLRDTYGYNGLVCSDWGVAGQLIDLPGNEVLVAGAGTAYGTEGMTYDEYMWAAYKLGMDQFGGLDSVNAAMAAYNYGVKTDGEEVADKVFRTAGYRAVYSSLNLGLFENPYVNVADSKALVGNESFRDAGYATQVKSVVMLKNEGNVIQKATGSKPTVYIPIVYTPESVGIFGDVTPASQTTMLNEADAKEFFNVVTDTVVDGKVVQRTDFTGVDFALVKMNAATSPGNQFIGFGYVPAARNVPGDTAIGGFFGPVQYPYDANQPIDNGYRPKTLQYREYYADPDVVRAKPIGVDADEDARWVAAGGEAGMSRYYGGTTATATNEAQLDLLMDVVENAGDVPVIAYIAADNPMVFSEFEPYVDAIVMGFGVSDRAALDIISGNTEPSGLLPFQEPANMATVEKNQEDVAYDLDCYIDMAGNVYNFGFGLNYKGVISDARTAKYGVAYKGASAVTTDAVSGDFRMVIEGFDWGPGVTKLILSLDQSIDYNSVAPKQFTVEMENQGWSFPDGVPTPIVAKNESKILGAYACDYSGNPVKGYTPYIAIELAVDPNTGNPFFYNIPTGRNNWSDPLNFYVTLNEGASFNSYKNTISKMTIDPKANVATAIKPQADKFRTDGKFTASDGKTLSYASYTPAADAYKNPLVVWLHGAGEGGTDPDIVLLGNKVTPLAGDEFQSILGGAYILTPQSPTMWMDNGDKNPETGAPVYVNDDNHVSIYTKALFELIDNFVKTHPDVDANNVIIGGCSNGGFMTMNMILNYPDYFAAAYPICEAYQDNWISDAQINSIKDIPIWFTFAYNDTTVNPETTAIPTIARLNAAGATDVHVSDWDDVHDTSGDYKGEDGNAYQYMGHWSWLYFFNDDNVDFCDGHEITNWEWIGEQAAFFGDIVHTWYENFARYAGSVGAMSAKSGENFMGRSNITEADLITALAVATGLDSSAINVAGLTREAVFQTVCEALVAAELLSNADTGKSVSDFSDGSSVSAAYLDATNALIKAGVITGSSTSLLPGKAMTRGELAQIIFRI